MTALSNVTLVKDNLEKYVKDSVLYPYLKEAGAYLIKLDTSKLGIDTSNIKTVSTENNKTIVELNTTSTQ